MVNADMKVYKIARDMYSNDVIDFAIAQAHLLNLHVRQIEGVSRFTFNILKLKLNNFLYFFVYLNLKGKQCFTNHEKRLKETRTANESTFLLSDNFFLLIFLYSYTFRILDKLILLILN